MPYRIAGIDVHKKMLAVAVADVEIDGDFHFERQKVGTIPIDLRRLADWLTEHEVEEVVMESTAQYWRPVWEALEQHWRPRRRARNGAPRLSGTLHLAQAQSNRGPGGRKKDFPDAERLVKRLVAQELTLSFVPDAEQRLWRTVMRRKYQVTRNRVQLQNRLEALLEEAHIKVSSLVSDLLGISARRMSDLNGLPRQILRGSIRDPDETSRVVERQRPKPQRVDDTEDRRAGTDTDPNDQDRERRQCGVASQRSHGISQIARQRLDEAQDDLHRPSRSKETVSESDRLTLLRR